MSIHSGGSSTSVGSLLVNAYSQLNGGSKKDFYFGTIGNDGFLVWNFGTEEGIDGYVVLAGISSFSTIGITNDVPTELSGGGG